VDEIVRAPLEYLRIVEPVIEIVPEECEIFWLVYKYRVDVDSGDLAGISK
jgi:hypothetical protein